MKSAAIEPSGVNGDKPTIKKVPHIFWRRFDIGPGVWRYRFRIGLNDRLMHNHRAETGKEYKMKIPNLELITLCRDR